MKRLVIAIVLVCAASLAVPAQKVPIKTVPLTLEQKIEAETRDFKGKVWIYAKNLETGKEFALRADEPVRTASTIKLPILTEVFHQVAQGKAAWTDEFTLTRQNKQGGSGVLSEFSDGTKIDLRTAANLMIVVSDNTATNLVIDRVGADNVNDFLDSLGLKNTRSMRKIGGGGDSKASVDPVGKLFGIGMTTPREMGRLLEMLERGQVVSKEASAAMIEILKRQQYKDGLGRNVPDTIPVASKSGSLDRLRSDVGIVYTRRGRIVMAITVDDMPVVQYVPDNPGTLMIWRLSQLLQEGLAR